MGCLCVNGIVRTCKLVFALWYMQQRGTTATKLSLDDTFYELFTRLPLLLVPPATNLLDLFYKFHFLVMMLSIAQLQQICFMMHGLNDRNRSITLILM